MSVTTNNTNDTDAATTAANGAAHGASNGATSEASKEAPKEVPKETPKEAGKAARKSAPKDASKAEAPKDAPKEIQPRAGLRLRMKVWTDPSTGTRYLMPTADLSDPASGLLTVYAMTDTGTKVVKLTPIEWNALPFFYFQEDGPAPRATARSVDKLR